MPWNYIGKIAATFIALAIGIYSMLGPGWIRPRDDGFAWKVSTVLTAALVALVWIT